MLTFDASREGVLVAQAQRIAGERRHRDIQRVHQRGLGVLETEGALLDLGRFRAADLKKFDSRRDVVNVLADRFRDIVSNCIISHMTS